MAGSTHYQILGVERTASLDQIKKAYRTLAMELHPDRNGGDKAKTTRFVIINASYDVLSDGDKRRKYDASLEIAERQSSASSGGVTITVEYEEPSWARPSRAPWSPAPSGPPRPPDGFYPRARPPDGFYPRARPPAPPPPPRPPKGFRPQKSKAHPFEGFPDVPEQTDLPYTFEEWEEFLKESNGETPYGAGAHTEPKTEADTNWDYFISRSNYHARREAESQAKREAEATQEAVRQARERAAAEVQNRAREAIRRKSQVVSPFEHFEQEGRDFYQDLLQNAQREIERARGEIEKAQAEIRNSEEKRRTSVEEAQAKIRKAAEYQAAYVAAHRQAAQVRQTPEGGENEKDKNRSELGDKINETINKLLLLLFDN